MITFYRALEILFQTIEFLIVIRILMSFMNINMNNPIGQIVYELTEPILSPARALLNKLGLDLGMFDFSSIVAILILRSILKIVGNMAL